MQITAKSRAVAAIVVLTACSLFAADATGEKSAAEYARHLGALAILSVAVAETMPPDQYTFRPHPDSMSFGALMSHIAGTNYAFCAGLKDADPPATPSPAESDKPAVVRFLSDSFDYCSTVIPGLTGDQLANVHGSPDGRLPGRDILLAMFVHVAHHRGQAEIYLRDRGFKPPSYRF